MKCRKRGCLLQKAILIILRSVPLGVISGICLCITGRQRGAVSNQTRFSWVCDATRATRTARPEPGHRQPGQQRALTSGGRGPSLPPQGGRRWPWPPEQRGLSHSPAGAQPSARLLAAACSAFVTSLTSPLCPSRCRPCRCPRDTANRGRSLSSREVSERVTRVIRF